MLTLVAIVAVDLGPRTTLWIALIKGRLWYVLAGDLVIGLPILAAWMADRRVPWFHGTRVVVAYAAAFLLVLLGLTTRTLFVSVPLGSTALLALVLFSVGREPSWVRRAAQASGAPRLRTRRAMGSVAGRFHLDACLRSSAIFGLVVLPCVAAIAVGPALTRITQSVAWIVVVPVGWLLMIVVAFHPLAFALLGWRESAFATRYCRTWSPLPVRPESVRRAVYLHGMGIALAFPVSLGAAIWVNMRVVEPAQRMRAIPVDVLTVLLLVTLGWAGYTVAAAAGDRVRSVVSMAGVFVAVACLPGALFFGPRAIQLALAAGAVAAVVPLGHLRRPRTMS